MDWEAKEGKEELLGGQWGTFEVSTVCARIRSYLVKDVKGQRNDRCDLYAESSSGYLRNMMINVGVSSERVLNPKG